MNQTPNPESRADALAINEFMNALQRLFKIGIYYPAGHAILDKATQRFMRHLTAVAGDNNSVTLEEYNNTLIVESIEIDSNHSFVQEFKKMLSTLGIKAIIIDREINMEELHDFVRKMLAFRSKVLSARNFTQIEVSEFPHSVTIKLKEFLARKDSSVSDDQSGESAENVESFIDSLAQYGLSHDEIGQCKALLESLPERLSENKLDLEGLPYASWDDVAQLLARIVKAGSSNDDEIRNRVSAQSNINALASILKRLERETTDKKSRESINLLVSIIKRPLSAKKDESPEDSEDLLPRAFPDKPYFSIRELQEFTSKNKLNLKILGNLPESSSANETLSIIIQLSQHEQSIHAQIRMQQLFREILSEDLSEKAWEILTNGLQVVVSQGNPALIAKTITLVVEPLRRAKGNSSFYLFLLTLRLCKKRETLRLWPYVINEILLLGSSADYSSYQRLCQFAASITPEQMVAALPQLKNLEAFENNRIAADIFHNLPPQAFPLFAFLLKTEIGPYIGERVVLGLRRTGPDWLIKAITPLLDLQQNDHKLFLYSYLRQAPQRVLPDSLKKVAAKIIAETLPSLPQEKRSETWVVNTINALAQLLTPEIREMLSQIAQQKKMLFIPEWPAECRKAASSVLTARKQRR